MCVNILMSVVLRKQTIRKDEYWKLRNCFASGRTKRVTLVIELEMWVNGNDKFEFEIRDS